MVVGCGHRGCSCGTPERLRTLPNLVTAVRTVVAVTLAVVALTSGSAGFLYASLAAYWVGDVADGALARRTGTETRTGAALDIVADRVCVVMFCVPYVIAHQEMAIPVAVFLANFVVIDHVLSLRTLRWPVLSPNYSFLIDRRLHLLNWSPVAKATNTALLVVVMVGTGSFAAAGIVAVAQLTIKSCCLVRMMRLGRPRDSHCIGESLDLPPSYPTGGSRTCEVGGVT